MSNFTNEKRQQNMARVVGALKTVDLDFNSIVFTFADIIQSTFLAGLMENLSPEERETMNETIIQLNHQVIDVLNKSNQPLMIDMVVMSNLIMDAVENAVQAAIDQVADEQS
jgi:uncharacterized protein YejL (UPF0352 family)